MNTRGKNKHSTPSIGLVEWFRPGDYAKVDSVLADVKALGVSELRTAMCWADWYTSEGDGWYAWLLPRLAQDVRVLPCFLYTPSSLGIVPKYSSPPHHPKAYADFIDVVITRFGNYFDWVELWNRPNHPTEWDIRLDPDWQIFSEMIGGAAYWVRQRGKKALLPGLWPTDLDWLQLMSDRGVLAYIDAVGVQGFPSSREVQWGGWNREVNAVRSKLHQIGSNAEVWITEAGFSTWRGEERAQVSAFVDAIHSPVERVYWHSAYDRDPGLAMVDSSHSDERDYHYGFKRADGSPKLLFQHWQEGGIEAVKKSVQPSLINFHSKKYTLITGGAGFIGTNLAHRLLSAGQPVMIFDNLSRGGVERNVSFLRENHGTALTVEIADIRDAGAVRSAVRHANSVFHFAAQVAVTTSLVDPRNDFEVNVGGTLNVLEAIRTLETPPPLLYTSTNKVYGNLTSLALQPNCTRYQPVDASLRAGIAEDQALDFHSPYGCSKGSADQYVLDYARSYGIPAAVFRMSCIYGYHQMGNEDQGWVAHFLIRALEDQPIVLYGDGMQVRDLLFVEDLVDAFLLAQANAQSLSGQAFNIGGGLGNTASLVELLNVISELHGSPADVLHEDWRTGDQRYYVSNTRKFKAATGWSPKVNVRQGVSRLYRWLSEARGLPLVQRTGGDVHALLAH